MIGKIFVTSSGYDPEKGKDVKDPYLGANPSLGACRPDIRKKLQKGGPDLCRVRQGPECAAIRDGRFRDR